MNYEDRAEDLYYNDIKVILDNNPEIGRRELSKMTGFTVDVCRVRKKWWLRECGRKKASTNSTFECKGDVAEASFLTNKRCKTVEDVVLAGNIDVNLWDVERFVLNSWEGFYKDKEGDGHTVVPLFQVKVWLKRKKFNTKKFFEEVKSELSKSSPKVEAFHKKLPKSGYMLELDVFDLHIGKLAWDAETRDNWDVKIAVNACNAAVDGLIERSAHFKFDKIVLPVGNDLLHIDNLVNETTAGTRQDCEGRAHKMFMSAYNMLRGQVDRLKTLAPVEILIVPGNHDLMSTFHLGVALWATFQYDKNVTVNIEPQRRKYECFGKCLIGYCHGGRDDPKMSDLPLTMMTEKPQEFANAVHRHWHIGHFHKSSQKSSMLTEDSFQGIVVRVIRSLTAADYWHYNKGFIQPHARGAESFVWHRDDGMVQHNLVYAR